MSSASGSIAPNPRPIVAVQPFGSLRAGVVETVKSGIEECYDVEVVVLPARSLPDEAYYAPRNRYRADRLLDVLERESAGRYTKVVGVTGRDISTSTENHADFGVFGLGDLGGMPCVVSTYRLGRNRASSERFDDRLTKAVNHELGHTFGVDHCPTPGCLMNDAQGGMNRVDGGDGRLCASCATRLKGIALNRGADNDSEMVGGRSTKVQIADDISDPSVK